MGSLSISPPETQFVLYDESMNLERLNFGKVILSTHLGRIGNPVK
jgi:hypothetical protein